MSGARRRVAVVGACGRMGEHVRAALAESETLVLAAALEASGHPQLGRELDGGVRLGDDRSAALRSSDVAIVFATPESTLEFLREAAAAGVPAVVGTTGFSAAQREEIAKLAERLPLLLAANFSVAVNVLFHLAREASRLLGPEYDAEIVELHHAAKRDAPSGTALRLAAAVAEGRGRPPGADDVLARQGDVGARPPGAIGVQALRGGDAAGEHTLMLIGAGERLELVHRSTTRDHFARGGVRAAEWLLDQAPGLYDMEQVLGLRT